MSLGAPDPTGGGGGGMLAPPQGGAGGGQGVQILEQIQDLLSQLAQVETDPGVQRAVNSISQVIDPLMQAVGANDQQNMTSGVANPTGGGEGLGDLPGAGEGSEGSSSGSSSFKGASKAAMANFGEKGHFSKSGSKGEKLQTDKTKNRK